MRERTTRRRTSTMLGAVALGVIAVFGTSSAVFAAPQDFGDVDTDRTGSITVHKFLNQAGTTAGDISAAPGAGDFTDPVADVEFTVYPLLDGGAPVDLGDPTSWDALSTLAPGAACTAPTGYTLGTPTIMPLTAADGSSVTSLPVGLYQVCETAAPANIIERAQPFIVTVPMPHEGGWVYDVHAYPKNGEGSIAKTIEEQQDVGLGSVVRFPVTVPVPRLQDPWTGFGIQDTLDSRLTPVGVADVSVMVDGVAMDPSFYTVANAGQTVSFELTAAGLAWLNEGPNAHVGENVVVTFAGTVIEVGTGTIPNTATFWPNNPGFDPAGNPPVPSNEVNTNWGDLEILKRASGTTGVEGTLAGAEFEVYAAADPYATDCSAAEATGDAIMIDGETVFTSDASGVVAITGLFVSDSVNPAIDATERCYVVKETLAPAGYVMPADPFTPVSIMVGDTTADNIEIENSQQGVPELPITGAAGQIILLVGGLGALAVASGLILMRRRKALAAR